MIVGLVLAGMGMGAAMTVASNAIMGNAPAHRAGMASAVEEVSYEFGNLTAVTIVGSLLSLVYAARVHLPADAPATARDSLVGALRAADGDPAVLDAARQAFDTGYLGVVIVLAVVAGLGAVATAWMLRTRDPHG